MKPIAIGLALSPAYVHSVQAGNRLPEIEIAKTENQHRHFRQIAVNPIDTELTVSGRMDAHLRYSLPRDEPQQPQNPVRDQTVAR